MHIQIDLKTRAFSESDRAYRLFPGRGYRYFNEMKDHSVVFLDNPGFPSPEPDGYAKNSEVLAQIVRSEEKKPIVNANDRSLRPQLEALDKADFSDAHWGKNRELTLGWLNGLYHQAKIGDLIAVPSPGLILNNDDKYEHGFTLIGEIVGEPERWTNERVQKLWLGRFLVRRVKWLARVRDVELDPNTAIALRTQNALISLKASSFEGPLGAAYKNVVIGDEFFARFSTQRADFTAFDNFHFNAFVMAVVAAYRASNDPSHPLSAQRSVYGLASEVLRSDPLVPEQEASIHSPGFLTLRGALLVPAIASALFALALQVDTQPLNPDGSGAESVSVVNSESAGFDPCELGIEQGVRDTLNILGYERWLELRGACQNASENDGLQSIPSVTTTDEADE